MNAEHILHTESLFDVTPVVEQEFLNFANKFVQWNHIQPTSKPVEIRKALLVQDIWYFFYLGQDCESFIIPKMKEINELRMEFLRLITKNECYQYHHEQFKENTYLCSFIALNLAKASSQWVEEKSLENQLLKKLISQDNALSVQLNLEESKAFQSKLNYELRKECYKDFYNFTKMINHAIQNAVRTKQTILQLIGQEQYEQLTQADIFHFLTSFLDGDEMEEVAFWKNKMAPSYNSTILFSEKNRSIQ